MRSKQFWMGSVLLALLAPLTAQINTLSSVLNVTPPKKVVGKSGETVLAELRLDLRSGYHVNSDKPSDPYLIPLSFKITDGAVQVVGIQWPRPVMQKFSFSQKPLSVFEGDFKAVAKLKIPAGAQPAATKVTGKLRYQACNDKMCLPPRTLDVVVPLEIRN